jgi:ankyrin
MLRKVVVIGCVGAVLLSLGAAACGGPIHDAARAGDARKLTALLDAKPASANAKDIGGWTPLFYAAGGGHVEAVALLLARGAKVNARDEDGQTPLMRAVFAACVTLPKSPGFERVPFPPADPESYRAVIALLLEGGADPNTVGDRFLGESPLHQAAQGGNVPVISLLCEHKAVIDIRGREGSTPLLEAAHFGQVAAAEALLAHGADANARNREGKTPLRQAAWYGSVELVRLLLDHGADMYARDGTDLTAIDVAALRGAEEVVAFFRSRGYRTAAIQDAVYLGDVEAVKQYLEKIAEWEKANPQRAKAHITWLLQSAAQAGQPEVVTVALEHGADPNAKGSDGSTPLHRAAMASVRGAEVVGLLLKHGAKPTALMAEGETPLVVAVSCGHSDIAAALLAGGADANARDGEGRTALHQAVHADQQRLGRRKAGAQRVRFPWDPVVETNEQPVITVLASGGANVNATDKRGVTPLHVAAYSGYDAAVDLLLANGANARVKTREGTTPLHSVAVGDGGVSTRLHIAESLLAAGAEVTARDKAGKTPLDLARKKGEREMVELLTSATRP